MSALTAEAHAKINLTLDVTGRRDDGYHTLRSVFQSVTLCDRVSLSVTGEGNTLVSCDRPEVPCGESNTVRRAAEAFFARTGIPDVGVAFSIEKRIPWQAGLGGGSADAAAAFRLLNDCFGTGLSAAELCEIGLSVGADVPFCLLGGTMLAQGVGEKLTPLPPLPPCGIVVCKPSAGTGTREAYEALDRSGAAPTDFTGPMLSALQSGGFARVAASVGNAFERTAGVPEVAEIVRRLRSAGAAGACMTGTGSAVFGLFADTQTARACAEALSNVYPDVFLCHPFHP